MNSRPATTSSFQPRVLAPVAMALLCTSGVLIGASVDDARAIVQKAQDRIETKSQRYDGLLRSFDANGKVTEKRWTYERLGAHGQSKTVIRFAAPAEVKGVALLIVNHADRASDQWLWTPAIERDRRIAVQDRSTRLFGTDFSFEDLDERDVAQSDYRQLDDQALAGIAHWRIESTPKPSVGSQYSKSVLWIRRDNYAYTQIDLWVKDALAKRLSYGDFREVQGVPTAHELTMTDLRRNSRTQLVLDRIQNNVPMNDGDFTLEAIRR